MAVDAKRVQRVFLAAVEAADRAAILERECGDDAELRHRVEALLQAHDDPGSFLDKPALDPRATVDSSPGQVADAACDAGRPEEEAAAAPHAEGPGSRIGPYKLLQQIGEGGMGTVWMAEQQEPVRRLVALKVIKAGMDSAQVIARFEAERQALALMDHPHIAKVFDGGTTASGRPYFVMELVKGTPITKYCDEHRLTPRQRLELFVPVCQALQHAHQKGIIHRDIKPSNVLVAPYDGKPVVKVIDFGVAKATGQRLTERTLFTALGAVVGTLEYMSPEQAELNNQDIDTRSDLYSLGVLLYELLTGTTPLTKQRLKQVAFTEMLRLIREEEPPKPSTRLSESKESLPSVSAQRQTEPAKLTKLVRGELDWIVMKALEKDRGRRYETANGLARDIERYLHEEVVEACSPSASYRLRKFARKNRKLLATATAFTLLLVLGAILSTWQAVRATKAETEARNNEAIARDEEQKARDAAAEATRQRERAEEKERQANAATEEAKAVLAFFQDKVLAAGRPEGQEGGLGKDVTLRQAVDAAAPEIAAAFPQQPLVEASIRHVLGMTYFHLGEYALAVQHLERARDLRLTQLGPDHPDTLSSTYNLADTYLEVGKRNLALPLLEETFSRRKGLLGPEHPETLESMLTLAKALVLGGKLDQGLPLVEEALKLARHKLGSNHRVTLLIMNGLEQTYKRAGKLDLALPLCEEIFTRRKDKLGPDHPDTLSALHNLAGCYARANKPDQAVPLLEQAHEKMKTKLGFDHPNTLNAMHNLARAYRDGKKVDKAVSLFEETLMQTRARLGPVHPNTLGCMDGLAKAYEEAGKRDLVLPLYEETLQLTRDKLGPDHLDTLLAKTLLANAYSSAGRFSEALPLYEEVLGFRKAKQGSDHGSTLLAMSDLAWAYGAAGKLDRAESLWRELLELRRKKDGPESAATANLLAALGHNLLKQQRYADAEPVLRECLAVRDKQLPDDWLRFNTLSLVGASLLGQKKYAEAEPLLLQGYEGMKQREAKIPANGKIRLPEALERLVQLYEATGQKDQADSWRKKLEETKAAAKPPAQP